MNASLSKYTTHVSPTSNGRLIGVILPLAFLLSCRPHAEATGHEDHSGESTATHSDEDEHEGHEEGHVELTEQQFLSTGIDLTVARAGTISETLTLPGAVTPNADAVLHVTPRVSGQVQSVAKQLGDAVTAGDLMCVLDSVELGDAVAVFLSDRELLAAAEQTLARANELYAGRLKALTTVLDGAIVIRQRIFEREEELQKKAVSTIRPLLEADREFQMAKLEREKQLTELEAERDVRVLELEVEVRTKRINLTAVTHRLRTLGLSATELENLNETSPLLSGEYRVYSPGSGIVVTRHVSPGEFVDAGAKLYIIENLSDVWFMASAFEEQLRSVRGGQSASVTLDAFPGAMLKGSVSFVDYHVDPTSRSVGVRITLDNQQLAAWSEELPLRPGMFGRAQLSWNARDAAVVLPEAALVHDDSGDYVFVQVEAFAFEHRDVTVLHVAGGDVEVTSGLEAGESVAISGTFVLKSAERLSELGGGHSH